MKVGILATIKQDGINIKGTRTFKYLGSVVEEQASLEN
jgi:hypothetical protein